MKRILKINACTIIGQNRNAAILLLLLLAYTDMIGQTNTNDGTGALTNVTSGTYNAGFGYYAGNETNSGSYNIFLGAQSGKNNTNGHSNVFSGYRAGYYNSSGYANTFTGHKAGYANTTGNNNTFSGRYAGYRNTSGYENVLIGYNTGKSVTSGFGNVLVGASAGNSDANGLKTGDNNVFIGRQAGNNNNGDANVFIGYQAGYNESGSNELYIDNSATGSPLIWGNFSTNDLTFNADVLANGNVNATGTKYSGDGKEAIRFSDTWLRLNPGNAFSSGTYLSNLLRVDGQFFVGSSGSKFIVNSTGNVGIGDGTPSYDLDVNGDTRIMGKLILNNNEVPTTLIDGMVYFDKNVHLDTGNGIYQYFTGGNGSAISYYHATDGWGALISTNNMKWITPEFDGLKVTNAVTIGQASTHSDPDGILYVDGNSYFTEVNVTSSSPWPDFVFAKDYDLKPLNQVETFIKENQHLPDVPSAKEVEENGINVGDMNAVLLKKIEELTLHLIEQNKQLEKLQLQVNKIENK
ncbi:MAG: hypothetical protein GY816_02085 [Cytophagales bacterium]|nr:hypothetical protein [Cytophagales bacterium]